MMHGEAKLRDVSDHLGFLDDGRCDAAGVGHLSGRLRPPPNLYMRPCYITVKTREEFRFRLYLVPKVVRVLRRVCAANG
jgi:hypothetical protein